ncbi:helix-turn-helix domain-containing protein [Gordoniibacillus kamchatkensis]|uniref:helix-turn-helix domain-containing protein n=1 Tax=Gordoniibacillus kamchatkensis TaxID=1590651 RepID=UPI0006975905|nr:XRE family transcriptional regulator [Paenibacillus sp. VKM B-2647]
MKRLYIGDKLKQLRKSKGLTTNEVAEKINVSQSYISRFENNRAVPDIEMLANILEVLGTDIPSFFTDESYSLPPDLMQLIETTKKLPSEERKALNEYLKVRLSFMNETSAAKEKSKVVSLVAESKAQYAEEDIYEIPLVGASAAGSPMSAVGYHEGNFEVPGDWGDFALRVKGDSMEPLIPNKGFVFVRQQEEVNNNEIALVKILGNLEEEVTIKRIRYRDDKVHLISENPEYKPMVYNHEEIKILGKVVKWLSADEGNHYLKENM